MIEIEEPGPRATIQDLGRPGYAALGVGRSGAADRASLRLGNRLVGNAEGLAALELTLGGLRARFHADALVAVTGAPCPISVESTDNRPAARREDPARAENRNPRGGDGANAAAASGSAGMNAPFAIRAGQSVRIGAPSGGLRTYLAVRGGIDVPAVLGSRSTDTLSGIGPAILAVGSTLPIGRRYAGFPNTDLAVPRRAPSSAASATADAVVLAVHPGPREDWFVPGALGVLIRNPYSVTSETDRIGARLDGPALARDREGELRSEGMPHGALQVPPDGRPILFLADHPVTGGYPVLAVLRAADLDAAGQLRPGDVVRFRRA